MALYWPLEPLFELVRNPDGSRCSQAELAARVGRTQQTVSKWAQRGGVPDMHADAVAVAAGYLPFQIWGDAWLDYFATLDIDAPRLCYRGHEKKPGARGCRVCENERKREARAAARKAAA